MFRLSPILPLLLLLVTFATAAPLTKRSKRGRDIGLGLGLTTAGILIVGVILGLFAIRARKKAAMVERAIQARDQALNNKTVGQRQGGVETVVQSTEQERVDEVLPAYEAKVN
jgi:hypothetical protein